MLYSISEIVINNIKSNCILKADFYKEDTTSFPRILSGTLIQPIYLKSKESQVNSSNPDFSLSKVFGYIKPEEKLANLKSYEAYPFRDKVVTLINEYGDIFYSPIDINGKYLFNNIQTGKYTILFPVLSDYMYTSPSVVVLNIEENGSFIINSSIEHIDH
ncbi:MSCRAMM family adhesin SdrC [Paraclostridium sp. AKS73]|nr:MSCRAMM family adhesin SdrC [Paraclostridium sp. AKS73]MCU9816532.1 MSCRAMM family adhesin SdrC [Paraclostridium sp. AKS73]